MLFEQVELHGASIITKADIGKGRSAITLGIDAPLTSEAAAALGCQEKLFTLEGEVRPDLFFSTSVYICFSSVRRSSGGSSGTRRNREAANQRTGCRGGAPYD